MRNLTVLINLLNIYLCILVCMNFKQVFKSSTPISLAWFSDSTTQ